MSPIAPKNFQDSPNQILEYYSQAKNFLHEHKIPPTPINYTLAYEYVAERLTELNREMQTHLERGGTIDSYFLIDMYERYFLNTEMAKLDDHVTDINQIVFQTLQGIDTASEGFGDYEKLLENQIDQLNQQPELSRFQMITANLLQATQQTQRVSNKLKEQLEESNQQITKLQTELEEARIDATIDPLTGLYNRKVLTQKLDHLIDQENGATPLSVLMLDIDHFKRFNDTYGHLIGDEVIRKVAITLKQSANSSSIAARYGGEEFILVMPNSDIEEALELANHIKQAVSNIALIKRKSQEKLPGITISIGAASIKQGEARDDLLERADQALYAAKKNGRNRVVSEKQLSTR